MFLWSTMYSTSVSWASKNTRSDWTHRAAAVKAWVTPRGELLPVHEHLGFILTLLTPTGHIRKCFKIFQPSHLSHNNSHLTCNLPKQKMDCIDWCRCDMAEFRLGVYRGQQSPARRTGSRQDKAGQGSGEQTTFPFYREVIKQSPND